MKIQERNVRTRLREDFEDLVDISDVENAHKADNIAQFKTTRALAALAVAAKTKISAQEAADYVTDESGDCGIDAIGISRTDETLYLIQSKTSSGSPSQSEVLKFIRGVELVLTAEWDHLGPKLRRHQIEIEEALDARNARVVAIYVHLGDGPLDESVEQISEAFEKRINSSGEILSFEYMPLRDVYEIRNAVHGLGSIDHELVFERWNTLHDFRSEIIGVVPGLELAKMVDAFGDQLYDKNIRKVLKDTEVNEEIDNTIRDAPGRFWYFNNGITIVANGIASTVPSPSASNQAFKLSGLSVVNGAQTCGALHRAFKDPGALEDVMVTVRVISTERQDESFESQVTRFTNTQNRIGGREFVSLDPRQQGMRDALLGENVQYCFRTGDQKLPEKYDFVFDLEEATRASAAFESVDLATRVKREIGRMWSNIHERPYTTLFNDVNDAAVVYNRVRFWRAVGEALEFFSEGKDSKDAKALEHSRYLATALIARSARKFLSFEDMDARIEEWVSRNSRPITEMLGIILTHYQKVNPSGYAQAFFKNQSKQEDMAKELSPSLSELIFRELGDS